jgi:hypothetical protein
MPSPTLANEAGVAPDEPHPSSELVPSPPGRAVVFTCRATIVPFTRVLTGSPADTHGQCLVGLSLRGSLPSQVAMQSSERAQHMRGWTLV